MGLALAARGLLADTAARDLDAPEPFSFERLRARAEAMAAEDHVPGVPRAGDLVKTIDYDLVQKIAFRPGRAIWSDGPSPFPVRLFHLNAFNGLPVRLHVVTDGMARHVPYSANDFDYGSTGLGEQLPPDLGYAGFRVMDGPDVATDWLAFQGASYFRSSGQEHQYGASARGIAINTALSTREEFPRFTEFWLSDGGAETVTIYALLDGPSVTGAYRFEARRKDGAAIDVEAALFFRADLQRLGLAPLTSMFWYGENQRDLAVDWRPEIHDSDGLSLWTGSGERIWRPLVNPPSVRTNTFLDVNPRGFGLMQRDRDFANYQDDGAFYNRRPSLWVEPKGAWGEGAVHLVEIPTVDEIHDNIVAYWQPAREIGAGDRLEIAYRLFFRNDEPQPPTDIARVVATRTGIGGVPGQSNEGDEARRKFVIDFSGGPLADMEQRFDVTPVVEASRGTIDNAYVVKVVGTDRWRALFDLAAGGEEPVDLRCFLRLDGATLSETWLYQHFPQQAPGAA